MRSSRASGRGRWGEEEEGRAGTSNLQGTEESRFSREHHRMMLLLLRGSDCELRHIVAGGREEGGWHLAG